MVSLDSGAYHDHKRGPAYCSASPSEGHSWHFETTSDVTQHRSDIASCFSSWTAIPLGVAVTGTPLRQAARVKRTSNFMVGVVSPVEMWIMGLWRCLSRWTSQKAPYILRVVATAQTTRSASDKNKVCGYQLSADEERHWDNAGQCCLGVALPFLPFVAGVERVNLGLDAL